MDMYINRSSNEFSKIHAVYCSGTSQMMKWLKENMIWYCENSTYHISTLKSTVKARSCSQMITQHAQMFTVEK